tara:strand:+ start:392 stop:2131 length:1740 start_codon:yes stop_codon:yes gene_type:complete
MIPENIIIMGYNVQGYNETINKGYKLRKDLDYIQFIFPIDYRYYYNNFDRNFIWSLQCWYHLLPYIYNFEKTKDIDCMKLIINEIHNWYKYILNLSDKETLKHLVWDDMATGIRGQILAYLNQYENNNINNLISTHISFLINENNWRLHNHCFFMCFGLIMLSEKHFKFAYNKLNELINYQFIEGIHCENSPEYHIKVYELLNKFYKQNSLILDKSLKSDLNIIYYNIFWLLRGDNKITPIGDSETVIYNNNFKLELYKQSNITVPHKCIGLSYKNFIYKIFKKTGYISIKNFENNFSFLMIANSICKNHKHADNLTFEIYYKQPILINPGKYAYTTDNKRQYVLSTRSHNCVQIEEHNYQIGNPQLVDYKPYTTLKNVDQNEGLTINLSYINEFKKKHTRVIDIINEKKYIISDTIEHFINFTQHFHLGQFFTNYIKVNDYMYIFLDDKLNRLQIKSNEIISVFKSLIQNNVYETGWYSPNYNTFNENFGIIIKSTSSKLITEFDYEENESSIEENESSIEENNLVKKCDDYEELSNDHILNLCENYNETIDDNESIMRENDLVEKYDDYEELSNIIF